MFIILSADYLKLLLNFLYKLKVQLLIIIAHDKLKM